MKLLGESGERALERRSLSRIDARLLILIPHLEFDVFHEFGDGGGKDFISGSGDEDIIFDADTDASPTVIDRGLSFGGFDVGGDVDPRLDGDDIPWLELVPSFGTVHVDPRVVNIQAEPVSGTVHIEVFVFSFFDQGIDITCEEFEVD